MQRVKIVTLSPSFLQNLFSFSLISSPRTITVLPSRLSSAIDKEKKELPKPPPQTSPSFIYPPNFIWHTQVRNGPFSPRKIHLALTIAVFHLLAACLRAILLRRAGHVWNTKEFNKQLGKSVATSWETRNICIIIPSGWLFPKKMMRLLKGTTCHARVSVCDRIGLLRSYLTQCRDYEKIYTKRRGTKYLLLIFDSMNISLSQTPLNADWESCTWD